MHAQCLIMMSAVFVMTMTNKLRYLAKHYAHLSINVKRDLFPVLNALS